MLCRRGVSLPSWHADIIPILDNESDLVSVKLHASRIDLVPAQTCTPLPPPYSVPPELTRLSCREKLSDKDRQIGWKGVEVLELRWQLWAWMEWCGRLGHWTAHQCDPRKFHWRRWVQGRTVVSSLRGSLSSFDWPSRCEILCVTLQGLADLSNDGDMSALWFTFSRAT